MTPCKLCEDRKVGCHASCERYIAWSRAHQLQKDAAKRFVSLHNINVNSIDRHDQWIKRHKC